MSYHHSTTSEACIDILFEEPAKKPSGTGWDKPINLLEKAIKQREYRRRTKRAADIRYRNSEKGKAAIRRYYLKTKAKNRTK
jgi:hypothetical protein